MSCVPFSSARVAHHPPVGDGGLGYVVGPEDDRLRVHEVHRLVPGEEATSVGRVCRVDQDVVPTRRSRRVTFVVALGVPGRRADDARETEARPHYALDQRQ